MSTKTQAEYTAVLERIHQLVPQFNPTSIMTDFETPLMNAWRAVFPNARSLGCYWHYCRVSAALLFLELCSLFSKRSAAPKLIFHSRFSCHTLCLISRTFSVPGHFEES